MKNNYKVNEIFQTIQGEGVHSGYAAIFIRLQGCDVGCAWCDTKHTWSLKEDDRATLSQVIDQSNTSSQWADATAEEILMAIKSLNYTAKLVIITGGEPCFYDLRALTALLHQNNFQTQIETSGTYPILVDDKSWVTVSPKVNMRAKKEVLLSALERANEIKHPVGTQKDIDQLDRLLESLDDKHNKTICLQPISQKHNATALCIRTCITRNWRLSVQLHKYLKID
ncbi:7-carboxy-7-deazaguanine synthase QueE [Psychromonas sp. CD1]|uniref:7-carboxy-7-deazaguanine synthase QueE n=1 Tax=Psychromonas sp. CD1 TaxID=1979839 RepID=UPI000B9AE584|nr:7-carboxy-7-deazaguanine synthase QueE [Psychromonas sp. CD1]